MSTSARSARPFRRLAPVLLMASLVGGAAAAPAPAGASGAQVLKECFAGQLSSGHSAADFRDALENMPQDMAEYTDCADQITAARDRALQGGLAGGAGSSGGGGTQLGAGVAAATGIDGPTTPDAFAAAVADSPPPALPTTPLSGSAAEVATDTATDGPFAMTVAGPSDGSGPGSGSGDADVPPLPVALALSLVALSAARGLHRWSRRPEDTSSMPGAA